MTSPGDNHMDRKVTPTADLDAVLNTGSGHRWNSKLLRWLGVAAAMLIVAALAYAFWGRGGATATPAYRTVAASRGNLVATVTATGNLQPINQVDVGSEQSGTVQKVLVDDNDKVTRGQVLAQLDLSRLQDQLASAKGALASAQAQVKLAAATVKEKRLSDQRLRKMAAMSGGAIPSQADLDASEAELQRALANESVARAAVRQAQATVSSSETNLSKGSIRSPIYGVVLSRQIEPGQTVAASLQAPVLFTLAEDLTQMELQVDVDEADVGEVKDGQSATFSVDAYPGREYPAKVLRVGFGSQTKDGVVSYLTELSVDNSDLSLRPGMTATATIVTRRRQNALLIPNAALRFTPPAQAPGKQSSSLVSRLMPRPPRATSGRQAQLSNGQRRIWILKDGQPAALIVTVGASDGRMTEITGGGLSEGMAVITERTSTAQ